LVRTGKKLTVSRTPKIFLIDFFGLFRENSVSFVFFDTGPKHRNKPKKKFFGFAKQTEKQPKQIEFRLVSVRTEKKFDCFEDTQDGTLADTCMKLAREETKSR
jgi:hypothetical protein